MPRHQGVYVLTDTRFRWLSRFAGASGPAGAEAVACQLHLPCGLLAGALHGLGVPAVVTAEHGVPPACACADVAATHEMRVHASGSFAMR